MPKRPITRIASDLEAAYQDFLRDLRKLQSKRRALIERFQKELERAKVEKIKKSLE